MSMSTQSILDAALVLPEEERVLLVEQLLQSLPADVDEYTGQEFVQELRQRSAEFAHGTADAIPWSELRKEI